MPRCQHWVSQRKLVGCSRQAWTSTPAEANTSTAMLAQTQTARGSSARCAQVATTSMATVTRRSETARQTPKQRTVIWNEGDACMPAARRETRRRDQMRLNTRVPLVPPKPKLFFTAYSIFMSRAVLAQ